MRCREEENKLCRLHSDAQRVYALRVAAIPSRHTCGSRATQTCWTRSALAQGPVATRLRRWSPAAGRLVDPSPKRPLSGPCPRPYGANPSQSWVSVTSLCPVALTFRWRKFSGFKGSCTYTELPELNPGASLSFKVTLHLQSPCLPCDTEHTPSTHLPTWYYEGTCRTETHAPDTTGPPQAFPNK